jgi:hypothetical protein
MRSHHSKSREELLDEALEKLFVHIENTSNNGEKLSEKVKTSIKDSIKQDLGESLAADDLNDIDVQKKLLGCITAKLMVDDKQYKSLITQLGTPELRAKPDPELNKKLQMDGFVLATLAQSLALKNDGKNLSIADAAKKLLAQPRPDGKQPTAKEISELEKQLDACLRNLFGGDNPTISGEINFPVLGPIFGNLCAYTNQSVASATNMSLMVEAITYNGGKPDPLGLEAKLKQTDLAEGIDIKVSTAPTLTPPHMGGQA